MDCSALSDDNFSLDDVKDKTGDWMRVGAFSEWLNERIFEETFPGRKMFQCSFLITPNIFYIAADGMWGQWGAWSRCEGRCGGSQTRVRLCNDPKPRNGGSRCEGEQVEERDCVKCQDREDPDQGRI